MPTRLEKLLWSVLAGAVLGLTGCDSTDPPGDVDEDEEMPTTDVYGPPSDGPWGDGDFVDM